MREVGSVILKLFSHLWMVSTLARIPARINIDLILHNRAISRLGPSRSKARKAIYFRNS